MDDRADPQFGSVPPGQEWWTRGLYEWHALALQVQEQLAQVQARERTLRVQMAALLAELLPHISGDPGNFNGLIRRATQAIDRLCRGH
jgi:hypothetical protein